MTSSRGGRKGAVRAAGPLVAAMLTIVPLGACAGGPERSVASFCSTLRSEKARITAQLEGAIESASNQSDPLVSGLAQLGAGLQGIGELRTYFRKLTKVAPDAIATEIELVAEEVDRQFEAVSDAASNPLGALVGSVVGGITASGPLDTVHQFALDNCGEGI